MGTSGKALFGRRFSSENGAEYARDDVAGDLLDESGRAEMWLTTTALQRRVRAV
jgi:hypothetical protein